MAKPDYAFKGPYRYEVDRGKYDKHRSCDYLQFRYVDLLLKKLLNMHIISHSARRLLWSQIMARNSRPVIRVNAMNYEVPHAGARVEFLLDTGSDVSMLTAATADSLGIDRDPTGGDPVIVRGIGQKRFAGLARWIYVFLGEELHPVPVVVPPRENQMRGVPSIPLRNDILGRAAVTSCFLMCFDNKRLYAFARRASEPGMR